MRMRSIALFALCCASSLVLAAPTPAQLAARLHAPPGFTVSLYADGVTNASPIQEGRNEIA